MTKVGYNILCLIYGGITLTEHRLLLFIFGATGDLASRKLYPAIYRLYKKDQISDNFAVICTARRDWSNDHLRDKILKSIESEIEDSIHANEFVSHFYYQAHDVHDGDQYYKLNDLASELDEKYQTHSNRIFFISLSPSLFPEITRHLKEQGLLDNSGFSRLIIEKPFGHNLKTAQELQKQLTHSFAEHQIYRIDHYLGKEIVHSLRYLRFNNYVLRNIWNKTGINNVQIVLDEEVGVETRAAYYENSGVIRDMIQNHLLQILALAAMDQPQDDSSEALRKEKVNVLSNLIPYQDLKNVQAHVIRGQYGPSQDGRIKGYRQENNVNPQSNTETFIAAKVSLNLPAWQGVPFFIRSGKRMKRKLSVINIVFNREHPHLEPNRLRIEIGPNLSYQMFINSKQPGYSNKNESISFKFEYSSEEVQSMPVDYERLIYECIQGDLKNFNHYQEIASAWKFVDSIIELWDQAPQPRFPNYPADSDGPQACHDLLAEYGTKWYY